jgi:hypothetical protein
MADDDGFDGRPYRDTLTVPSVLVMPDDPWPSEFYSRYPDAFRMPVRIVWQEGSAPDDGSMARLSPPAATAQPGATADARAEAPPVEAPSRGVAASVEDARSGQGTPVATFLRVNGFLDRLMDRPEPGSEGAHAKDERTLQDPNTPIPFFDDQGKPVPGSDGKQMMRPAGLDPHFFVRQGLEDKEIMRQLTTNDPQFGALAAGSYLAAELSKFRWYHQWDAQRIGGIYHDEFRDFATVAIGLYAAAAGVSESDTKAVENIAAMVRSRFKKGESFDPHYVFLPDKNVKNTETGYKLFREGAIRADEQ